MDARPQLQQQCVDAIGVDSPDAGPGIDDEPHAAFLAATEGSADAEPLSGTDAESAVCGGMLKAWAQKCLEPDVEAAT